MASQRNLVKSAQTKGGRTTAEGTYHDIQEKVIAARVIKFFPSESSFVPKTRTNDSRAAV